MYLLCGGNSTRMGRDKAGMPFRGTTLLGYQLSRTSALFRQIVLLSAERSYDEHIRSLNDAIPDAGPLGGLLAACSDAKKNDESHFALLALDLPDISPETLRFISTTKPTTGTDAIILKNNTGIQPLAGVYSPGIEPKLNQFLKEGNRKVRDFLREICFEYKEVGENELRNLNKPGDVSNSDRIER